MKTSSIPSLAVIHIYQYRYQSVQLYFLLSHRSTFKHSAQTQPRVRQTQSPSVRNGSNRNIRNPMAIIPLEHESHPIVTVALVVPQQRKQDRVVVDLARQI